MNHLIPSIFYDIMKTPISPQTQLNSALQARQLAEESIGDLKQELANATSHLGSFVRHEMEIEHEEAMEKARKDVEVLRNEINNKGKKIFKISNSSKNLWARRSNGNLFS